jgi:hypothetical protein
MVKESSCAVLPGEVAMMTAFQTGSGGTAGKLFPRRKSEHL